MKSGFRYFTLIAQNEKPRPALPIRWFDEDLPARLAGRILAFDGELRHADGIAAR
jgi:hypothetical protein